VPDRARLDDARVDAATDAAQAELGLGRAEEAVQRLSRLARDNPMRERVWELFALALYRCRRSQEALAACAQLRRTLRDELGLDPGPGMARLEGAILRQDPALDGPVIAQVPRDPRDADAAAPDESEREPFVGREGALRELSRAAASATAGKTTCVLIAGSVGAGETRLVGEFAATLSIATVAWGRATEGTHRASLRVWRQIADGLGEHASPDSPNGAPQQLHEGPPDHPTALIVEGRSSPILPSA
jgi:hypothetical protein